MTIHFDDLTDKAKHCATKFYSLDFFRIGVLQKLANVTVSKSRSCDEFNMATSHVKFENT